MSEAMDVKSLADVELRPETAEEAYRRGYRDGWIGAYNALPFRRAIRAALDRVFNHWQGPLVDWQRGDCSREEPPPEVGQ